MELNYEKGDSIEFHKENRLIEFQNVIEEFQFQSAIVKLHIEFPCTSYEKNLIVEKTKDAALPYHNIRFKHCFLQKFERYNLALRLQAMLKYHLSKFLPIPLTLLQIEDSGYVVVAPLGEPFRPRKEELFEFYNGKVDEEPLFITQCYKQILRSLIRCVRDHKALRIRSRIDLDNIFILPPSIGEPPAYTACFVRLHPSESVVDDDAQVIQNLKNLIERINGICCIKGIAWKAEFDIFFDGLTSLSYTTNNSIADDEKIFDNALFWTKAERIIFLKKILELSKSENIEISDDWKTVEPPSKRRRLDPTTTDCMLTTISTIVHAYDNFGQVTEMWEVPVRFEKADQVVEFAQHHFPRLVGQAAQCAKKLGWHAPVMDDSVLVEQSVCGYLSSFGQINYGYFGMFNSLMQPDGNSSHLSDNCPSDGDGDDDDADPYNWPIDDHGDWPIDDDHDGGSDPLIHPSVIYYGTG